MHVGGMKNLPIFAASQSFVLKDDGHVSHHK